MGFHARHLLLALIGAILLAAPGCGKKAQEAGREKQARIYMAKEQYTEAETILKDLLAEAPDNAKLHALQGDCYLKQKKYDDALLEYNTVSRLAPDDLEALVKRATIEMEQGDQARRDNKPAALVNQHYHRADGLCAKVQEKDPNNKDVMLIQGRILLGQDKPDEAIAKLTDAIKAYPDFGKAYLLTAEIYARKRELDKAIVACQQVLDKIKPDEIEDPQQQDDARQNRFDAVKGMASLHKAKGDIAKAIEVLANADVQNPTHFLDVHFTLGDLYAQTDRLDEALAEADKIETKFPKHRGSMYLRGRVALRRGVQAGDPAQRTELLQQAVQQLHNACAGIETWADAHYYYGEALRRVGGRNQAAMTEYVLALKARPDLGAAHNGLARLHLADGSYEQAIEQTSIVIAGYKDQRAGFLYREALLLRSTTYRAMGDLERARKDLDELLSLAPEGLSAVQTMHARAQLFFSMGLYDRCLTEASQAISLLPPTNRSETDLEFYVGLTRLIGDANLRLLRPNQAISAYREALMADPSQAPVRLDLARALVLAGERPEARKLLEDALNADKTDATSATFLARLAEDDNNDVPTATRYFRQAIERNPKYLPAYSLAGMYLLEDKPDEAIDLWKRSLEEKSDYAPSTVGLIVAYLAKRDQPQALELAEKYAQQDKESLVAYFLLACAQAYAGQWDAADKTIAAIPGSTENGRLAYLKLFQWGRQKPGPAKDLIVRLGKAVVAVNDLRRSRAIDEINKALQIDPECIVALSFLSSAHLRGNETEKELADYDAMIKALPEYASSYYLKALAMLRQEKLDEAVSLYRKAIQLDPQNARVMLEFARLRLRQSDYDEAEKVAAQVIKLAASPQPGAPPKPLPGAHGTRGAALEALSRLPEAQQEYEEEKRLYPDTLDTYVYDASGLLEKGEFQNCISLCQKGRANWPGEVRFLICQARAHEALNQINEAEMALRDAVDISPANVEANYRLADFYFRYSRPDLGLGRLQASVEANPNSVPLKRALADALSLVGQPEKAIDVYDSVLGDHPDDVAAIVGKARALLAMGQKDNAKQLAEKVKRDFPSDQSISARQFLSEVLLNDGSLEAAAAELEAVLRISRNYEPAYGIAAIYFAQGRYEQASKAIEDSMKLLKPGRPTDAMRLAVALMCQAVCSQLEGRYPRALELLQSAQKLTRPGEFNPQYVTANVHLAQGSFAQARAAAEGFGPKQRTGKTGYEHIVLSYSALVDFCQKNTTLTEDLANSLSAAVLYSAYGWKPKAVEAAKHAADLAPDTVFAQENLAQMQEANNHLDEAIACYTRIITKLDLKNLTACAKLGALNQRQNKFQEAISWYRKAAELSPDQLAFWQPLAKLYIDTKRYDDAVDYLSKIEKLLPESPEPYRLRAHIYQAQGDTDKERQEYEKVIEKAPNDPMSAPAYNNLAWILATQPQPDLLRATGLVQRARNLVPGNTAVRDTSGWIWYLRGMKAEAYTELSPLWQTRQDEPRVYYHMGRVAVELGVDKKDPQLVQQGLQALEKALKLKAESPQADFPELDDCRKAQQTGTDWLKQQPAPKL